MALETQRDKVIRPNQEIVRWERVTVGELQLGENEEDQSERMEWKEGDSGRKKAGFRNERESKQKEHPWGKEKA